MRRLFIIVAATAALFAFGITPQAHAQSGWQTITGRGYSVQVPEDWHAITPTPARTGDAIVASADDVQSVFVVVNTFTPNTTLDMSGLLSAAGVYQRNYVVTQAATPVQVEGADAQLKDGQPTSITAASPWTSTTSTL